MSAALTLATAANRYFMDPEKFLTAFERDHLAAIIALRDNPTSFGSPRNYVGKLAVAFAHKKLLAVARREWKRRDPNADIRRATHRPRCGGRADTPPRTTSCHHVRGS